MVHHLRRYQLRVRLFFFSGSFLYIFSAQALTLEDAYRSALEKHETVAIAVQRIAQQEEKKSQSLAAILPSLSLSAAYTRQEATNGRSPNLPSAQLTLTQALFRGLGEYAQMAGDRHRLENSEWEKKYQEQLMYREVARAWYDTLIAEVETKNLQTLLKLTKERADDLKRRSRIGRSRKGEVLSAETQVLVVSGQVRQAESTLRAEREQLSYWMGQQVSHQLQEKTVIPSTLPKPEMLVQRIDARPDVAAAAALVAASAEDVVAARAGHFPSIDASANYYLERPGFFSGTQWDVGVSVTLPLFSGGAVVARTGEAQAKELEQRLILERLKREAKAAIVNAYEKLQGGLEQLSELKKALTLAEANYKEQIKDYRLGLVTNLEVLQSLNSFQETQRNVDRLNYETRFHWVDLQVEGGMLPKRKGS